MQVRPMTDLAICNALICAVEVNIYILGIFTTQQPGADPACKLQSCHNVRGIVAGRQAAIMT